VLEHWTWTKDNEFYSVPAFSLICWTDSLPSIYNEVALLKTSYVIQLNILHYMSAKMFCIFLCRNTGSPCCLLLSAISQYYAGLMVRCSLLLSLYSFYSFCMGNFWGKLCCVHARVKGKAWSDAWLIFHPQIINLKLAGKFLLSLMKSSAG